jgi:tRNA (guanine6-N2)-methyltransferase
MARHRAPQQLPACYAVVQPGLEAIAAEEIEERLGGEVKKTNAGIVVFRAAEIDHSLLHLRTTEDVFLLAWGTDQLTYRAEDLDKIRRWTERNADWDRLLRLHHGIRPKPKGKPTYRLVVQMTGHHGYRRVDARKALARGLAGKLPASWPHVEENAAVEIWLTIHAAVAVCGVRLSDRSMRHRTYKAEHLPASLRPTVAAAMVRLAEIKPHHTVVDPLCGAGTILAEVLSEAREGGKRVMVLGGDLEREAVRSATANLRRLGEAHLTRWDARRLPLADQSVDRLVSNLPFGIQIGEPEEIGPLYRRLLPEFDRVLRPGGRAVLLVADPGTVKSVVRKLAWKLNRLFYVRVLGQRATLLVYHKE